MFLSRVVLLIGLMLASVGFGAEGADRFNLVAGRLVEAINARDYAGVRQDFGKVMLDALPPAESKAFFKGMVDQYGKITALGEPRIVSGSQAIYAVRYERGRLDVTLTLDSDNNIIGLLFLPHQPEIPVPEKNTTVLRLPFNGKWTVVWGGDTRELNYHHDTVNQKYAFDFVVTDAAGKSHKDSGRRNEDYYAFGKEVVAPAAGVVTEVIDGVRDNVPGSMNPYSAVGNTVIIQHAEHEVSVLAHFKQGSIRVQKGEKVKKGQLLGLCGNSGNSSEAHVHYHLQNTEIIQDGTGIKCFFEKLRIIQKGKSKTETHYSPIQGDIIEKP